MVSVSCGPVRAADNVFILREDDRGHPGVNEIDNIPVIATAEFWINFPVFTVWFCFVPLRCFRYDDSIENCQQNFCKVDKDKQSTIYIQNSPRTVGERIIIALSTLF